MRTFLFKISIFSIFLLLYFLANYTVNIYLKNRIPINLNNSSVLIMGDSHTYRAIDPSSWDNAFNVSKPAEPYIITYWKFKEIIQFEKPDTLLLGFSPHNLSTFNDIKFANSKWSKEMFKLSYTFQNFEQLDQKININLKDYYQVLFKQMCYFPRLNHQYFLGSFNPYHSEEKISFDSEQAIERHYYTDGQRQSFSLVQKSYLDSIIELSKESSIEVVLVSTPLHSNYYNKIPADILETYDSLKNKLANEIVIIEGEKYHMPDEYFMNVDHINGKGADRFTDYLQEELRRLD